MHHRLLLQKVAKAPLYVYCDIQDVVMRITVVEGEVEVYVKQRNKREIKAAYDSRMVGLALSREPIAITEEQYDNFFTNERISLFNVLNLVYLLCYPIFEQEILIFS